MAEQIESVMAVVLFVSIVVSFPVVFIIKRKEELSMRLFYWYLVSTVFIIMYLIIYGLSISFIRMF